MTPDVRVADPGAAYFCRWKVRRANRENRIFGKSSNASEDRHVEAFGVGFREVETRAENEPGPSAILHLSPSARWLPEGPTRHKLVAR